MSYAIAGSALPQEERDPTANQMIVDVVRLVTVPHIKSYLTEKGWSLDENYPDKHLQIYTLSDPEEPNRPFLVYLPVNPQSCNSLGMLQEALERLAHIEDTTFVTILCRILQVEQIVLVPERS